jgi:hypothetical protein
MVVTPRAGKIKKRARANAIDPGLFRAPAGSFSTVDTRVTGRRCVQRRRPVVHPRQMTCAMRARLKGNGAMLVGSRMKSRQFIHSLLAFALLAAWTTSTSVAAEQMHGALKADARVPEAEARKTALAEAPGGTITSAELEREHGKLIWSFDIAMPKSGNITEVQVDANAGTVVSTVIETPADQAREAAADRKVKK